MARLDYKARNSERQHIRMAMARTIGERYPDIDHVDVEVTLDFQTWVCSTGPKLYKHTMSPESKIHLYYDCPNRYCTGSGFDLTFLLEDCLRKKKVAEGTLHCNGKEDAKYAHASACSCMTTCTYKLVPIVKA